MKTRLQHFRDGMVTDIRYPEDVARLRRHISRLGEFSNSQVQDLYHEYSESMYCASWLILDENTPSEFEEWLLEEVEWFKISEHYS